MSKYEKKFEGQHGAKIHCTLCDATTEASDRPKKVHEYFTVGCVFCQWEDIAVLREKLKKVTEQRDALAAAIDVKRTLVVLEPPKEPR